jgi:ferredoxin/flavodoxin---NADP+ reductase
VQDNLLGVALRFCCRPDRHRVSVIGDPGTYDRSEKTVLVHGRRQVAELAYGEEIIKSLTENEFFGDLVTAKFIRYPTLTREPFHNRERITALLSDGNLCKDLGRGPLEVRLMLCGNPSLVADLRNPLEQRDFVKGSHSEPGHFVIERAFVERRAPTFR